MQNAMTREEARNELVCEWCHTKTATCSIQQNNGYNALICNVCKNEFELTTKVKFDNVKNVMQLK